MIKWASSLSLLVYLSVNEIWNMEMNVHLNSQVQILWNKPWWLNKSIAGFQGQICTGKTEGRNVIISSLQYLHHHEVSNICYLWWRDISSLFHLGFCNLGGISNWNYIAIWLRVRFLALFQSWIIAGHNGEKYRYLQNFIFFAHLSFSLEYSSSDRRHGISDRSPSVTLNLVRAVLQGSE